MFGLKPKATYGDLYNLLSYQTWKTGIEMRKELEAKGLRAGHMRGLMYVELSNWEDQKLIRSRKRELTEADYEMRRQIHSEMPLQTEYLRISTGEPKKLFESAESGLEGCLQPV